MAIDPLWLQNLDYPARIDRTVFDALWTEGVIGSGDFAVTQSASPGMNVRVAVGIAVVQGDDQVNQGKYVVRNDASVTGVTIGTAPGSGQRNDLVVLKVRDQNAGVGSDNDALIQVVAGTASSTPVDPAVPDTALVLARVRVPAGTGSITNSLIDDLRPRSNPPYQAVPPLTVGTSELIDLNVTTAKLANLSVTTGKIADLNVTEGKIADSSITSAKIVDGTIVDADINAAAAIAITKLGTGNLPTGIKVAQANFLNNYIPSEAVFTIPGTLLFGAKNVRYYCETARTVTNVVASVGVAPSGSNAVFDVNKNGTTIFTTQANRPTITAGSFYDGSSVPNVTSFAAGDYITVDVDAVGATTPGSDAVIKIIFG